MSPTTRRTLESSLRHHPVTRDLRPRQLPTVTSHAVPTGECQSDPPSLSRAVRCSTPRGQPTNRASPLDVLLHVRASDDARGSTFGVEGLPPELRERLGDELIDQLLAGARTQEEIVGPGGLLAKLTKRLVERAMDAELTDHLGYERGQAPPGGAGNARNGTTSKTVRTDHGPVRVETSRLTRRATKK